MGVLNSLFQVALHLPSLRASCISPDAAALWGYNKKEGRFINSQTRPLHASEGATPCRMTGVPPSPAGLGALNPKHTTGSAAPPPPAETPLRPVDTLPPPLTGASPPRIPPLPVSPPTPPPSGDTTPCRMTGVSGDTTPCRMTGVTLHSSPPARLGAISGLGTISDLGSWTWTYGTWIIGTWTTLARVWWEMWTWWVALCLTQKSRAPSSTEPYAACVSQGGSVT